MRKDREDRQAFSGERTHSRKRRSGILLKGLIGFLLLILVVGGVGTYYVYQQLKPVTLAGEIEVEIPSGSSLSSIANKLEEKGVIKNATVFSYYVRYEGTGATLKAGTYQFSGSPTVSSLIDTLSKGSKAEVVRFTIPEGWNVTQIAQGLAEKGLIDREKFLKEVNEGDFSQFDFVSAIPKKEGRKYRLEGYLFPETYEVKKGADEHEIILTMLRQFEKEWKPEWNEELKKRNMTPDDAVNLASIVEREVVNDKERPTVAGIFYNRIRDNWKLQSCATVQFVLGKQRDVITFKDLEVESPYNTYIHEGLPPGPIASPGRASLDAVAKPEQNDYFFFVTKKDGTQEHYFSKTFAEHASKNAKSQGSW
ncbi:endolytic transglycosylase MltG [Brevibacillus daliensis]|uniref:endolytic transglycosylase MltG n=1 Tax=Brevibacillus daliensis TaxID=2892995 RepID=UPI001E52C76D|nr:endolytic transglycosylase MltG [Brevibacillus daliensis]